MEAPSSSEVFFLIAVRFLLNMGRHSKGKDLDIVLARLGRRLEELKPRLRRPYTQPCVTGAPLDALARPAGLGLRPGRTGPIR